MLTRDAQIGDAFSAELPVHIIAELERTETEHAQTVAAAAAAAPDAVAGKARCQRNLHDAEHAYIVAAKALVQARNAMAVASRAASDKKL